MEKNKTFPETSDVVRVTYGGVMRPDSRFLLSTEDCWRVAERIAAVVSDMTFRKGYFEMRMDDNLYLVSFVWESDGDEKLPFCKITPLYSCQAVLFDRRVIERLVDELLNETGGAD